ncbi:transcription factor bHLH52-like [Phalaenopsis equestris]|uniref:transcription factor bHLH52-like n=1 Tax=Phalaenopsis equestris TaxID=78828 RepID=UPI0009E5FF3E|nr:transcription factor bHLH52-like [Phalaenopsis equestris]
MEQIIEYDSVVADALFGFPDSPPFLPPFSDSTILTFPPPPPCDISSVPHSSPKRHHSGSDLYIHDFPQPHFDFEIPDYDPTLFAEFEAPQPPSIAMVAPFAQGVVGLSAQSMAARGRRKRISEKMLELGGLVPGGNRRNTAPDAPGCL